MRYEVRIGSGAGISIVVEHLESLKLEYPPPKVDLEQIRKEYHAAKVG